MVKNNNHAIRDKKSSPDSNLKEMCIVVNKEMCRIDFDAPAYKSEQENLRKKEQSETTLVNAKGKKTCIDENEKSTKIVPANNTSLIKTHPGSTQNNPLDNINGQNKKVLFDSDIGEKEPPLPTAHSIMRRFIQKFNVVTFNGHIYIYNGRHYVISSTDEAKSLILDSFRDEIKDNPPSFVSNIIDYIKIEPDIRINDSHIRSDIVSFANGVLNLRTWALELHHPSHVVMYSICGNYMPGTQCNTPNFDNYLLTLTGGDTVLIKRIYQTIGYILSPDTRAKKLILLQGTTGSGKTVLTNLLEKLFSLGSYYPMQADKLKGQFALSELFGRALCVCQDMPNEALDMKAVSVLKCISGNDTISSDVKFKSAITFKSRAKIILTTNFAVVTKSPDNAFYSRLLELPCRFEVPKSQQNPDLVNLLFSEKDGIITKSMNEFYELMHNGYEFAGNYLPNSAIDFNEKFSEDLEMNIYNFTMSMFEPDSESHIFTDDAYELYISRNLSIARNNFSEIFKKICQREFGSDDGRRYKKYINNLGEEVKSKNALRCVLGIRLKTDAL